MAQVTTSARNRIRVRDGHVCQYCGTPGHELTVDHIVPVFDGGRHEESNLRACCHSCNSTKSKRSVEWLRLHWRLQRSKYGGVISAGQFMTLKALGVSFDELPAVLFEYERSDER